MGSWGTLNSIGVIPPIWRSSYAEITPSLYLGITQPDTLGYSTTWGHEQKMVSVSLQPLRPMRPCVVKCSSVTSPLVDCPPTDYV